MYKKNLDKNMAEPVLREMAEPVLREMAEPVLSDMAEPVLKRKRGRPCRPYGSQEEKQRRHDRDMAAIRARKPQEWQKEEFKPEEGLECLGNCCMMYDRCHRPLPGDKCDAMF